MLLTMSLHLTIAMQLICGVAGVFTDKGVPSKLSLGRLSKFHAQAHAAAYTAEEWYWLHQ